MKAELGIVMVVGATLTACYCRADGNVIGSTEVSATVINPKYSVAEAIDVCIKDLEECKEVVNERNLRKRCERMSKGDVVWPGDGSGQRFEEFVRSEVKKYYLRRQSVLMKNNPYPQTVNYDTEKSYVDACIAYRIEYITPVEKDKWSKRMGGLNSFKREVRNEATKVWRAHAKKLEKQKKKQK